jgi:hypothetical protein
LLSVCTVEGRAAPPVSSPCVDCVEERNPRRLVRLSRSSSGSRRGSSVTKTVMTPCHSPSGVARLGPTATSLHAWTWRQAPLVDEPALQPQDSVDGRPVYPDAALPQHGPQKAVAVSRVQLDGPTNSLRQQLVHYFGLRDSHQRLPLEQRPTFVARLEVDHARNWLGSSPHLGELERRKRFEPSTPSLGSWPRALERHHGVLAVPFTTR